MQHDVIPRHAKIAWLVMERFSEASAEQVLSGFHPGTSLEAQIGEPFCRKELEGLPDDTLDHRYVQRQAARVAEYEADMQRLEEQLPLNTPGALADHEFWARQALWTIEEAIALSMNRNPKAINSANLSTDEQAIRSRFAREYFARLQTCQRALEAGLIQNPMPPGAFVAWFDRVRLRQPQELFDALSKFEILITDWKVEHDKAASDRDALLEHSHQLQSSLDSLQQQALAAERASWEQITALRQEITRLQDQIADTSINASESDSQEELLPKQRRSHEIVLAAIAKEKFRYDPKETRSSAPKNICDCVERVGLSIDRGTVLKLLKQSAKQLPT